MFPVVFVVLHSHYHSRSPLPYMLKLLSCTRETGIGRHHCIPKNPRFPRSLFSRSIAMLTGKRFGSAARIPVRQRPRIPTGLVVTS